MITQNQIIKGQQVLLKYLLPDCLKPEYDGFTAYEISRLVLEAGEMEALNEIGRGHDNEEHFSS